MALEMRKIPPPVIGIVGQTIDFTDFVTIDQIRGDEILGVD